MTQAPALPLPSTGPAEAMAGRSMMPLFETQEGGCASALTSVAVDHGKNATIGRWRHGDAEPRLMAGDGLIKIVVNISADHRVERLRHGVWTSKPFDIFSFSIVPPDEEFRFSVKGQADILQIFLPQAALAAEPGTAAAPTIRASRPSRVRICPWVAAMARSRASSR